MVVLTGVEGRGPLNAAVCDGLSAGGVNWGIDLEDWTAPMGPLWNLRMETLNRQKAVRIAMRIAEYKFGHPDSPVVVVGQSGGGGMALWVAEAMPEAVKLDGLILLAPAISPGYAVEFALGKTTRGVVSFYSNLDWIFLGLGTTVYGTMDGRHGPSAGMVSFRIPPADERPDCYDRLFQIAWHEQMARTGHIGAHVTTSAEAFVSQYVAPFVLARKWDEQFVAAVLNRWQMQVGTVPMPTARDREPPDRPSLPVPSGAKTP